MNFKDVLKKIANRSSNIIIQPFKDFYINLSLGMHFFLVLLVLLSFFYFLHLVRVPELKPEKFLKEEDNNLIIVLDSVEIADFNNLKIKKTDFDSGTKAAEKKFATIVPPPIIEEQKFVIIKKEAVKEIIKAPVKAPFPLTVKKEEAPKEPIQKEELKEIIKIIKETVKEPIAEIIKEIKASSVPPAEVKKPAAKVSANPAPAPKLKPTPALAFKKIESAELKEDDELASLLKSMELQATAGSVNKTGEKDGAIGKGETNYDDTKKIGIKYINAIRSKFARCWNIPIGGAYIEDFTVTIQVELDIEGNVIQAIILPKSNMNNNKDSLNNITNSDSGNNEGYNENNNDNSFYQVFAESALRAVHLCGPIKNLPKDQFSKWHKLQLTFNAKDAL